MKRTGLTLGKYAPLHRGHQRVIETALAEMDHLIILIYDCPDVCPWPLNVRARWLRDLYPRTEVVECWDGPTEMGDTPRIREIHETYLRNRLSGRTITHFYSSEFYGDHVSRSLGAVNRLVDPDRVHIPVSGTDIRADPFARRSFLHPRVYRDLILNVVFLGAPSTGKTTLAGELARVHKTVWMPEYGRTYWDRHQKDRRLTREQLVEIAQGHLKREEALLERANRYLFTDTNALTTRLFSLYYHESAAPPLCRLADEAAGRYDLVFLCDTDIPYHDTWDRSGDVNRRLFQNRIIGDLRARKIPYLTLGGSVRERTAAVNRILSGFRKYDNIAETIYSLKNPADRYTP
jgi:NadR type nicotinamide-nucleotide adenylyltransferase